MLAQSISVILVVHFLKKFQIIAFRRIVECRGGFRVSFDIETSHCTEKTDGKLAAAGKIVNWAFNAQEKGNQMVLLSLKLWR